MLNVHLSQLRASADDATLSILGCAALQKYWARMKWVEDFDIELSGEIYL